MQIHFGDETFELLIEGGMYWPCESMLLCSDLHLGKEASFSRMGLGVPRGASRQTLARVSAMLQRCRAEQLVILGDLFHNRSALAIDVIDLFQRFMEQHHTLSITLVSGNHDRSAGDLPADWRMHVEDDRLSLRKIELLHEAPSTADSAADTDRFRIAGHLHPAVQIRWGDISGRYRCFWQTERNLILPALGQFTGAMTISRQPSDKVWALLDEEIVAIQR
ncbi:MAG: ligase-associated DNA damage response endonuclease PdeM [Pirellulaceae bacterium]